MSSNTDQNQCIWEALTPKTETKSKEFIDRNPYFDGRGVIVGILDTGVDPGAVGLSITSIGKVKLIDSVDCSGSGDVIMKPPVRVSDDGTIPAAFGERSIIINPAWVNPTGLFRVGYKRATELYPGGLKERLKDERAKEWSLQSRLAEAEMQKDLKSASASSDLVEDIKLRVAQLRSMTDGSDLLEDPGPIYDCVVFHDGQCWQAVVDTSETGDMSSLSPMTDYGTSQQFASFSSTSALNYCVNIFDDGGVLSLVVDCGAHGSHVAGIVAAFHPEQPELNGVAPGAQIVSLKIGDTRLGSMETGVGLIRALREAVKRGCHVINMSYGEATAWDNYGAFVQLANEIVHKHGVVFVSSAGNNGPCISTVGCPGGTSSCCIGVGAMYTTGLMHTAYSMYEAHEQSNYVWSSVGPTLDGDLGVSIMAPGGAVTSVPNWTLNKMQLMNGTSMSSPNAAGCIALLISAAKANQDPSFKISPTRIRRAVENSCAHVSGVHVLGQGFGLVQVPRAWELFCAQQTQRWGDVRYDVSVNSERYSRGIYLRQPQESSSVNSYAVKVEPRFHEDIQAADKVQFEVRFALLATQSWVTCPEFLLLLQEGKQFNVKVDPCQLPVGLHVAFVCGYPFEEYERLRSDPSALASIELFRFPVTVVRPEIIPVGTVEFVVGSISLEPGERYRRFIVPPFGCSYVDAHIVDDREAAGEDLAAGLQVHAPAEDVEEGDPSPTRTDPCAPIIRDASTRTVVLHALQLFRGTPYRNNEYQTYITLHPGHGHSLSDVVSWSVHDGVTMELALARSLMTVGRTRVKIILFFRGVLPSPSHVVITGGQRVSPMIRVRSPAAPALDLNPSAKLDSWCSVVKPSSVGVISPLGERDTMLDGSPIYELVLDYEIDQAEAGDVTPRWPGLQGVLYESDFMAQFYLVFDSRKKLIGCGDAFPKKIVTKKGKHAVRLQVKHTSANVLEGLVDLPMQLMRPLKSAVTLAFYKTQSAALAAAAAGKQSKRAISAGGFVSMFIREPSQDQLPKGMVPGDSLLGSITYKNSSSAGSGSRPGGHPITYVLADTKSPTSTSKSAAVKSTNGKISPNGNSDSDKEAGKDSVGVVEFSEAVRDAKIKYLKGLAGKDDRAFRNVYAEVSAEFPDKLSVKQTLLQHLAKMKPPPSYTVVDGVQNADFEKTKATALKASEEIIAAATNVIESIDQTNVAAELGRNIDESDLKAKSARTEFESQRLALVEALAAKAEAYLSLMYASDSAVNVSSAVAGSANDHNEHNDDGTDGSGSGAGGTNKEGDAGVGGGDTDANKTMKEEKGELEKSLRDVIASLKRWEDFDKEKEKYWVLYVWTMKSQGRWGAVLKRLNELLQSTGSGVNDTQTRVLIFKELHACLTQLKLTHLLERSRVLARLESKDRFDPF